jgi:hypothetical protein
LGQRGSFQDNEWFRQRQLGAEIIPAAPIFTPSGRQPALAALELAAAPALCASRLAMLMST